MRPIKFRALPIQTNISGGRTWLYGYYFKARGKHYIIREDAEIDVSLAEGDALFDFDEIDPETLGMFTGLEDKNGQEIYGAIGEKGGDIVKRNCKDTFGEQRFIDRYDGALGIVKYCRNTIGFYFKLASKHHDWSFNGPEGPSWYQFEIEIIGNQAEHPELLEKTG